MRFQDRKDDFLLAVPREILETQRLAQLYQLGSWPALELGQVHDVFAHFELFGVG